VRRLGQAATWLHASCPPGQQPDGGRLTSSLQARSGWSRCHPMGGLTCGIAVRGCPLLTADPGWSAAPVRPVLGHAEGTASEDEDGSRVAALAPAQVMGEARAGWPLASLASARPGLARMRALSVSASTEAPRNVTRHATASSSSLQEVGQHEGHNRRCRQHGPRHRHPRGRGRPQVEIGGRDPAPAQQLAADLGSSATALHPGAPFGGEVVVFASTTPASRRPSASMPISSPARSSSTSPTRLTPRPGTAR
jgi:hypothetical protein